MTKKGLSGPWFCLLVVCFLVWPSLALVPKPEQCLVSGIYNVTRLLENKDGRSCRGDCVADPDCHMAVVAKPLTGSDQCLLVNCLNQGKHSYIRDPSAEIRVYPKTSTDDVHCWDVTNYSGCQSGVPRFFYNGTSFRCERFSSGCGSSRNMFDTQEGCEALCSEKFRCYRPVQYGGCRSNFIKFFYNMWSQRCERFDFSGCGSNGNIFDTIEECERLCGDVKATTTSQPAVDSDTPATVSTETTATTTSQPAVDSDLFVIVVVLVVLLVAFAAVAVAFVCIHQVHQVKRLMRPFLQDPEDQSAELVSAEGRPEADED